MRYLKKTIKTIHYVSSSIGIHERVTTHCRMRTCIECRICSFFFQLTDTPLWSYCAASTIGLLPTTVLNCYMGSTLRTMSDVLTDQSNQTTGYLILSVQVSSLKKKKYIYVLLPAKNLSCSISLYQ